LIRTYTNDGETVLDNCIGSGSTAIAAINTNRNFIGFELDANYYNVAKNRVNQYIIEHNLQDVYGEIA
jgi:site-specific DNA-methyltransferase (adenine-specific)